jgi:hypothetical protein
MRCWRKPVPPCMKGRRRNLKLVECPKCGFRGKGGNMTRYYFDKCKYSSQCRPAVIAGLRLHFLLSHGVSLTDVSCMPHDAQPVARTTMVLWYRNNKYRAYGRCLFLTQTVLSTCAINPDGHTARLQRRGSLFIVTFTPPTVSAQRAS